MSKKDNFQEMTFNFQISELNARVIELRNENNSYLELAKTGNKKTDDFVNYFQVELEKKEKIIERLMDNAKKLESERDSRIKSVEEFCKKSIETVILNSKNEITDLNQRLQISQSKLDDIMEFKKNKLDIDNRIDELHKVLIRQKQMNEKNLRLVEKRRLEDIKRLKIETEKKITNMMYDVRKEAQKGIDADSRKIVADNRRIAEELRFLITHIIEIQKISETFLDLKKDLSSELRDYVSKEEVYAKEGIKKSQLIREIKQRIETLNTDYKNFMRDSQKQIEEFMQKEKTDTDLIKEKILKMQNLIKLKNKELSMITKNSQIILNQRTQLEQLFLRSLSYIKQEYDILRQNEYMKEVEEYTDQMKNLTQVSMQYPVMNKNFFNTKEAKPPIIPKRVTQDQLPWEGRIKVLKLLFGKLNEDSDTLSHYPPTNTRSEYKMNSKSEDAMNSDIFDYSYDFGTQPDLC